MLTAKIKFNMLYLLTCIVTVSASALRDDGGRAAQERGRELREVREDADLEKHGERVEDTIYSKNKTLFDTI